MHLDAVYVLSALWGGPLGPQVCLASPLPPPASAVTWAPASQSPAGVTAFVAVNVVPMDTERVLVNHTVVVEGGRITALGPVSQVAIPTGAVRIDGQGQYLMPGLGAMHDHFTRFHDKGVMEKFNSHVFLAEDGTVHGSPRLASRLALYLAGGVTSIGSLSDGGGEPDVSPARLPVVRRYLEELPGPRAYIARSLDARGWFDGLPALLAAAKTAGYDHLFPDLFFDSLVIARRVGLPVTIHNHAPAFEALLALGSGGSTDHQYTVVMDIKPALSSAAEQWRVLQARAAALARVGAWVTPNLRCEIGAGSGPSRDYQLKITKTLHEAGVRLLLSEDDQWDAYDELLVLVQAGLTPYEALVTGTRNIAEYFSRQAELGTVAVGKQADLVLLRGNPLADIRATLEPAGVMVRGRWLDRAALDRQLLAHPTEWFRRFMMQRRGDPTRGWMKWYNRHLRGQSDPPPAERRPAQGYARRTALAALIDSLESAQTDTAESTQLLGRFAAELGALRAVLPGEQQREWLDPQARAWVREQARQGYRVTVPGVVPTP